MSLMKEFREFISRGNVVDMAVGVIVGGAFSTIVNSLVNDIIMPVISIATGKIDFSSMFIALNGEHYASLNAAKDAGAAVFAYGSFIQNVIQFLLIAFVLFMVIKGINKAHDTFEKPKPAEAPTTKIWSSRESTRLTIPSRNRSRQRLQPRRSVRSARARSR